jgi:hypothetical protein
MAVARRWQWWLKLDGGKLMPLVSLATSNDDVKLIGSACNESCHVWTKIETGKSITLVAGFFARFGFFSSFAALQFLYLGSNSRKFYNQFLYVVYASSFGVT